MLLFLKHQYGWSLSSQKVGGFRWREGSSVETKGVHIWPEAFLMEDNTGRRVAVFLMDTQGAFDNER